MDHIRMLGYPMGYCPMALDPERYYVRRRLHTMIEQHKRRSLIGVFADRGYGKTSMVYSYLAQCQAQTIWYNLNEIQNVGQSFDKTLAEGLAALKNEEAAAGSDKGYVMRELYGRTEPLYIVIDEVQAVKQDDSLLQFIKFLLDADFPCLTLVLIGTAKPALPFTSLKTRGRYLEFSAKELSFTKAETADFFLFYRDMPLKKHEVDIIYSKTSGWVASYHLILDYLDHITQSDRSLSLNFLKDIPDVYDYLSKELFEREPKDIQEFMLRTSLLTQLDPSVIDQYLDITNSEEILSALARQHTFLTRNEAGVLQYHHLFRAFLYERYDKLYPDTLLREHTRLSEIFRQRCLYLTAFAHAVASMDYPRAAELMHHITYRYNPIQFLNVIDGKLEDISPRLVTSDITLFLMRCIPEKTLREFLPLMEEERAKMQEADDLIGLSLLEHRMAGMYYHLGDPRRARDLLESAIKSSNLLQDYGQAAFSLQLLADCCFEMCEYENSMMHARHALFLTEKYGIRSIQIHCLEVLSRLSLHQGAYEQADAYISQALDITPESSYAFFWLYVVKSWLYADTDPQLAVSWAEKAVEKLSPHCCDHDKAYTYLALGQAHLAQKDYAKAAEALATAYGSAETCSLLRYRVVEAQCRMAKLMGCIDAAVQKERELSDICIRHNYTWLNQNQETAQTAIREIPKLKIQTLGKLSLTLDGTAITFKRMSSLRILLLLLVNRNRETNRDIILEEVFPDMGGDHTNHFHVAMSGLRKALMPADSEGKESPYLSRNKDRYSLNMQHIQLDAEDFLLLSRDRSGSQEERIARLLKANSLYQGDFLEEYPYEGYLDAEREGLRKQHLKNLYEAAAYFEENNEPAQAVACYERIVQADPYEENAYLSCCRLLLAANARSRAKTIANKMIAAVETEMGIPCKERLDALFHGSI